MKNTRYLWWVSLLAAMILSGPALSAQKGQEVIRLAKPQPTETPGKIEVIEFFWYGCPHCSQIEPALTAWEKKLPADVVLRREHVVWQGRKDTELHARLYQTLRAMGLLEKHHTAVFDALHNSKGQLRDEAQVVSWAVKQGIDKTKFEATFKSFGVQSQVSRAQDRTWNYSIDSVPSFIVNGRSMTSLGATGNSGRLFAVLELLIAEERAAKKK